MNLDQGCVLPESPFPCLPGAARKVVVETCRNAVLEPLAPCLAQTGAFCLLLESAEIRLYLETLHVGVTDLCTRPPGIPTPHTPYRKARLWAPGTGPKLANTHVQK